MYYCPKLFKDRFQRIFVFESVYDAPHVNLRPWCWLAKVRLDKAKAKVLQERPEAKGLVHYHPFMIDPATEADGEEYMAYNRRRWGSDGWTSSMKRMGRKEGAPYANWKTWPNTTHCGRLLLLAASRATVFFGDSVSETALRCLA